MDIVATTRYVRLSPKKARDLARALKGRPVPVALAMLGFSGRRAAFWLRRTLRSAVANAENTHHMSAENLVIARAEVQEGPRLKRWTAVARGSAHPIQHRYSHIRIVLAGTAK